MPLDVARLKKKYEKIYTTGLPEVEKVSTQNIGLDYILSGGVPLGRITMLYGPSAAGKSTTSLSICKAFINQGYDVAYIDAERTVSDGDFKRLSIDVNSVPILRPKHAEEAIEFMSDVAELGASLVIVDSIPALEPKARLEKLEGDPAAAEMAIKARFYAGLQGLLVPLCESHNMTVLFINQIRTSLSPYAPPVSVPGGSALKFMCTSLIELRSNGKLIEGTNRIKTTFLCMKNKVGPKGLSVDIEIGPNGLDNLSAFVSLAQSNGLVVGKGAWYYFSEEMVDKLKLPESEVRIGQGISSVSKFFSNPDNHSLYECLYGEIVSKSKTKPPDVEVVED